MRRKSERTVTKGKSSPEKKVEKPKRTRSSKRRRQSSENESAEESSPEREVVETVKPDVTPQTPEDSKEDQEQVWHVKAADSSGDSGEIHKLKICLARPPSTPEKVDKSPRFKRKHSRATSSSDNQSVEAVEEKKKSRHRSRHSTVDSKDSDRTNEESQEETDLVPEQQTDFNIVPIVEKLETEAPVSTTKEEVESADIKSSQQSVADDNKNKSDADSTVNSLRSEVSQIGDRSYTVTAKEDNEEKSPVSTSLKSPNTGLNKYEPHDKEAASSENKVSICEDNLGAKHVSEDVDSSSNEDKAIVDADVVELSETAEIEVLQKMSCDSGKGEEELTANKKKLERSESSQLVPDDSTPNGHAAPIVINRKRKWGSRPSKLRTQKSITISTDVLKEIIPDVKPTAFDEVIEEKKKHKRVEVDKVERPVLPKIVIDNTEQMDRNRDVNDEKENSKYKEPNLGANRKISIVNDNNTIMARPLSPPKYKQSNILYITNLVRPFTLPQLKNLLQRTGRIVEDGFWIDKIKSKCFVKYETEDQAVETRHALHGVTWPVSNPKTLQVDFSTQEAFDKAKTDEETNGAPISAIPGTVEDWIREQDIKREKGEIVDKPWDRKTSVREWDVGKNQKDREREPRGDRFRRDERGDRRRPHSIERSPEPARKFKKKEEEPPAKLLDDLFRKTKAAPCIYWLPLSDEMIAIKEEQRRLQLAEHERRLHERRPPPRRR